MEENYEELSEKVIKKEEKFKIINYFFNKLNQFHKNLNFHEFKINEILQKISLLHKNLNFYPLNLVENLNKINNEVVLNNENFLSSNFEFENNFNSLTDYFSQNENFINYSKSLENEEFYLKFNYF